MIDPAVVEIIVGGFLGLTILGITQIIKNFFWNPKADPPKVSPVWAGYVISLVVSAGFTAYYLLTTKAFGLVPMLGYTAYVWAVANGIFKATHSPTTTPGV